MNLLKKIIGLFNSVIKRLDWYNNVVFPDCKKFWNHKEFDLDIVNLGSSSAKYGFDYSEANVKAANWAMAPQSFVGDLAILQNYCSYLKPNATVIIPLCPFSSLGGGNDDLSDKYYTIVRPISIPHASLKRRNAIIDIENRPLLYYPIIAMISDVKHLLFGKKKTIITDLETDADNWIASWKKEFSIYNLHNSFALINKDRFNDSVIALKSILSFCVNHDFKPVIVIPPMTRHLSLKFDDTIRKRFIYDFIQDANIVDARVLDYINHPILSVDVNFMNSFLINKRGANLLTKQVIKDLALS